MRLYRPTLVKDMEKDQAECRRVYIPEDEILHHLVDRYHPTHIELRRVRHPIADFLSSAENERMLLSEIMVRQEIRMFNKSQRLGQEIAAIKEDFQTVDGKRRKIWQLYLVTGEGAKAAAVRVRAVINGNLEKEKRLNDKARRPSKFRNAARKIEQAIESRKRRGRRK